MTQQRASFIRKTTAKGETVVRMSRSGLYVEPRDVTSLAYFKEPLTVWRLMGTRAGTLDLDELRNFYNVYVDTRDGKPSRFWIDAVTGTMYHPDGSSYARGPLRLFQAPKGAVVQVKEGRRIADQFEI